MKNINLLLLFSLIILVSCSNNESKEYDNQNTTENIYKDIELCNIYKLQNKRDTKLLIEYLQHDNAKYRDAAALAFASVQDSSALDYLFQLLNEDKSQKVRISSAFAIGQTKVKSSQNKLINAFNSEKSDTVRLYISEAMGRCGDTVTLNFLVKQLKNTPTNSLKEKAVFMGISRLFIRGVFSQNTLIELLNRLDNSKLTEDNLYVASIALSRSKKNTVEGYDKILIKLFENTKNINTQLNIINALSKSSTENSHKFLTDVLKNDNDYRLKVNAIFALSSYDYKDNIDLIISMLHHENPNVSIRASEYIVSKGNQNDAERYISESSKVGEWRTRANLLTAALKYTSKKAAVSKIIKKYFTASTNEYEKAQLLSALGYDINNYKFVSAAVHSKNSILVGTYGMMAIKTMCLSDDFEMIDQQRKEKAKKSLKSEFAYILKDAIMSKDVSKITIAAEIIRNSKPNFIKEYENTYFLNQALKNCEMPNDLEAYLELQKTIAHLEGKDMNNIKNSFKKAEVDWGFIAKIPYDQKLMIKTNKGNIIVQLFVNQSPISVANFLQLADKKFFNNKHIHRVVPNFVVQDGCPRGDGWGSPNYTICSEFAINYYEEGSLGMVSAGKDTESSQWFITHSPTPHLDGNYTNFGKVVKGMDVVHKLTVGDKVLSTCKLDD